LGEPIVLLCPAAENTPPPETKEHAMQSFVLYAMQPQTLKVFWISYVAWCLLEIWIFSRDRRAASGKAKDYGSVFVNIVMITAGNTVAFVAPYMWSRARIALPPMPVFQTAIAMIWAGIALRLWAVLTLGRHFRTSVRILDDHKLVTSGPYRVLRHPSYTGDLLAVSGIGLAMGNWIALAGAFGCIFLAYSLRILIEESALRVRFGEAFKAYRKRTWAFIPPLW
jgi:protein-S-isoprenylcysteine O-methyltransferase